MRFLALFASFTLLALVHSAANSYGDEQVTPSPGSAPAQPAAEEAPVESLQETPEGAGSQVSGYDSGSSSYSPSFRNRFRHRMMKHRVLRHRVLRHRVMKLRRRVRSANSYGDEQVTPAPSHAVAAPAPIEQGPSYQPPPPAAAAVHPPPSGCGGGAPPHGPPPPPPSSSYARRLKRVRVARNAYGDEQVTPGPSHGVAAPPPVEQGPSYQPQAVAPPAPPVPDCPSAAVYNSPPAPGPAPHPQPSGYAQGPMFHAFKHRRVARAANSYGDEQVTPAPGVVSSASTPEESPVDAIQETSEGAGSQTSGYESSPSFRHRFRHRFLKHRVLRHRMMKLRRRARAANSYGDEQVTPAPGSAPAQPAPEEAPVESEQETPEGAGSQVSGYDAGASSYPSAFRNRFRHRMMKHRVLRHRVLRHRVMKLRRRVRSANSYGDEQITAAPAAPETADAPEEAIPEVAQQPEAAPEGGAASIQPSGYRA